MFEIAASLMCCDQFNISSALSALAQSNVSALHFDIMDGYFVKNIGLGLELLRSLADLRQFQIDVHLLVQEPERILDTMTGLSLRSVVVHGESKGDLSRTLTKVKSMFPSVGLAINPFTRFDELCWCFERLDYVLLMLAEPGRSCAPLISAAAGRIMECRVLLDQVQLRPVPIHVDGGVTFDSAPNLAAAGANVLVCGRGTIFSGSSDIRANVARLRTSLSGQ